MCIFASSLYTSGYILQTECQGDRRYASIYVVAVVESALVGIGKWIIRGMRTFAHVFLEKRLHFAEAVAGFEKNNISIIPSSPVWT